MVDPATMPRGVLRGIPVGSGRVGPHKWAPPRFGIGVARDAACCAKSGTTARTASGVARSADLNV